MSALPALPLPPTDAQPLPDARLRLLAELTQGLDAGALLYVSGYAAGLAAAQRRGLLPAQAGGRAHEEAPGLQRPRATVLYASQTGNGRRIAEALLATLEARGLAARAVAAGDYALRELAQERLLYLIASTHGDGDPPEDARAFFDFILGRKAPGLKGLRYAVLALGDSGYPKFCEAGRIADEQLAALGATALAPRVDCDVDFGAASAAWSDAALRHALDILKPGGDEPRLASVSPLRALASTVATRDAPVVAEVLVRQRITGRASDHPVTHLEIAAPADRLAYEPGDAAGIWHHNPDFIVARIAEMLKLDLTASVACGGEERTLGEWLTHHREITRLSRPVIEAHARRSGAPALEALVRGGAQARAAALRDWQLLDLLEAHAADWTAGDLVAALRPLAPRLYSIASSRSEVGDELHLTVAAVDYRRHGARRVGAASHFLASEAPALRVYIEPNTRFRLPADGDRDIIMIGAGTGIAPYRGFLQERGVAGARGRNWLIFGARRLAGDFLYQAEWLAARKRGLLHRLDFAASRDGAWKVYVQDRLREHGAELWRWIEGGASLYVCGDAARLAPAVHAALADVVRTHGGHAQDSAQACLDELVSARRYLRDVY